VKELFKSFEDEKDDGEDVDESEDDIDDGDEEEVAEKVLTAKDKSRVEKVTTSFKALEKAKKEVGKTSRETS